MKRLELKNKLDELYGKFEEVEETLRGELRKLEEHKDELGSVSDQLDEPLEDENAGKD